MPFVRLATDFLNAAGAGGSAEAVLAEAEMLNAFLGEVAGIEASLQPQVDICRRLLASDTDPVSPVRRHADQALILMLGQALLQWFEVDTASCRVRMDGDRSSRSFTMADYDAYKSRRLAEQRLLGLPAGLGRRP